MKKLKRIILSLSLPLLMLSGCEYIMVDVMPLNQSVGVDLDSQKPDLTELDNHEILAEKVAVFPVYNSTGVPEPVMEALNQKYQKGIEASGLIQSPVFLDRKESRFQENGNIRQKKEIYLDTLYSVSVSDKELSGKIGQFLDVEQFLVMQVSFWPCGDCLTKDIMRMKSRLIDAKSGEILWTGIHEEFGLVADAEENREIGMEMANKLTTAFVNRFKEKWHKKRFKHLAQL